MGSLTVKPSKIAAYNFDRVAETQTSTAKSSHGDGAGTAFDLP